MVRIKNGEIISLMQQMYASLTGFNQAYQKLNSIHAEVLKEHDELAGAKEQKGQDLTEKYASRDAEGNLEVDENNQAVFTEENLELAKDEFKEFAEAQDIKIEEFLAKEIKACKCVEGEDS